MGLKGILTPRGVISGSWLTFNGNYNKLTNKPTLNGVTIEGDKTSEDYHIESGGGGGGGTDDYNDLNNKPQINDVTLSGNKSLDALGIQAKISYPMDNTKYLDGEGNFTTPPSGGGNYQIDVLLNENEAVTINTSYTFLDNHTLSEYDAIEIIIATKENVLADLGYDHWIMNVQSIIDYPVINYGAYGQRWFYATFTNTSFTQNNTSGDQFPYVYRIYGIKYN